MKTEANISLLPYNTFGIDARADVFISYDTEEELKDALCLCRENYASLPILHIGGGSNLLFLEDFHGVVFFSCIEGVEVLSESKDDIVVRVGAGVTHDAWVEYAVSNRWHGLENLSLIPGQVGASAVQNIGAYGVEACDVIESVEGISLLTGEKRTWSCAECDYGYRRSIFKEELKGCYAITYVTYRLQRTYIPQLEYGGLRSALQSRGYVVDNVTAQQVRDLIIEMRTQKLPDPKVTGNAGSFFMNPVVPMDVYERISAQYPAAPHYSVDESHVKVPAGWLIEQCGWKGRSLGPAAVHDRQALVLVNKGGATGQDIVSLCNAVRADVQSRFGIDLHPEVNFIGCLVTPIQ